MRLGLGPCLSCLCNFSERRVDRLYAMLIAEPGDQVEKTGGSVISRPAEIAVQAEPAVTKRDIKTSEATIVVATHDSKRWPFLSVAVETLLSGSDGPRRVIVCVDQNKELYERVRLAWPEVMALLNSGNPWCFGNKEHRRGIC